MAESPEDNDGLVNYATIPTPQGRDLILKASGPVYEAAVAWILEHNPGTDRGDAETALDDLLGPWALEDLFGRERTVEVVPCFVYPPDGSSFQLLETDLDVVTKCTLHVNASIISMR